MTHPAVSLAAVSACRTSGSAKRSRRSSSCRPARRLIAPMTSSRGAETQMAAFKYPRTIEIRDVAADRARRGRSSSESLDRPCRSSCWRSLGPRLLRPLRPAEDVAVPAAVPAGGDARLVGHDAIHLDRRREHFGRAVLRHDRRCPCQFAAAHASDFGLAIGREHLQFEVGAARKFRWRGLGARRGDLNGRLRMADGPAEANQSSDQDNTQYTCEPSRPPDDHGAWRNPTPDRVGRVEAGQCLCV